MRRLATLFSFALFGAATAAAQNLPSYVPANGLAAWYPFSGNAVDSSGKGNTATVSGPVLVADRWGVAGKAYRFNGTSDKMEILTGASSSLNFRNSSFTMSLWFKANWKTATQDMQLFFRGDPQPAADPYLMYLSGDSAVLRRDVGTGSTVNSVKCNLSGADTALFHHMVGTYDSASGQMTLYLDGAQVNQATKPGTIQYNTNTFSCFIGSVGNAQFFKGVLDDIGVWTRVLSACEITKLYQASSSPITQQPVAATVANGNAASFSIQDVAAAGVTYQWQVNTGNGFANLANGAPYSGVTTKVLSISPATTALNNYQYRCLRTGGGCVDASTAAKLQVTPTASVAPVAGVPGLALYPNPNSGAFTLRSTGIAAGTAFRATVLDATGRVVRQLDGQFLPGETAIDCSSLVPGVYALKLTHAGGQQVLPFVKQ